MYLLMLFLKIYEVCYLRHYWINFNVTDLAQSGYLDDAAFLRFLDYLQYFKRPQYAKFIT